MNAARCSCGRVVVDIAGAPITSVVCYCDTCQEGSRRIEALPGAAPILDANGGTTYVLYREDHVRYDTGAELLRADKLDPRSTTSRVVATCCNSAMHMRFDDIKHWVPVYRGRLEHAAPPVAWHICTRFKPAGAVIAADLPQSADYPPGMVKTLLLSWLAMLAERSLRRAR